MTTTRADIAPGAAFPDFELRDHTGTERRLSDLQTVDPLVIALSRGGYCPKDHRQHQNLVRLWQEMRPGIGLLPPGHDQHRQPGAVARVP